MPQKKQCPFSLPMAVDSASGKGDRVRLTRNRSGMAAAVGFSLAWALLGTKNASAEIELFNKNGWSFYTDGRLNAFYSYTFGDAYPAPPPDSMYSYVPGAGLSGSPGIAGANNKVTSTRIRSGYLGNILAFGVKKDLGHETTLNGYFALWTTIETDHTRFHPAFDDVRESYLKVQGPWGSVLAGRTLGLFAHGSVEIDFNYAHGYGLGYPCNLDGYGPTCGNIGFGVLFPFFSAGLVYKTPPLGGFAIAAGAYDPVILAGNTWELSPLPRVEGEATYDLPLGDVGKLHLSLSGLWQQLGQIGTDRTTDVTGIAGAARVEVGPVRIGVAAHTGAGLGFFYALEDTPSSVYGANDTDPPDAAGKLRTFDGYFGQVGLVLGKAMLAGGYGVSRLHQLDLDKARNDRVLPKQQAGINAGFFYHFDENLVASLDYFRADFSWYDGAKQGVNTVNGGLTMTW